jgi:hypothetical protein
MARYRDDDDTDDDDYEESRPRKKKKKPKKMDSDKKRLIVAGAVTAALLLIGCVASGIFAYFYFNPTPDKTIAGVGYFEAHEEPDYAMQAYFPGSKPKYEKVGLNLEGVGKLAGFDGEAMSFNMKIWEGKHAEREYTIAVGKWPTALGDKQMWDIHNMGQLKKAAPGAKFEDCTVGGRPAIRVIDHVGGRTEITIFAAAKVGDEPRSCLISVDGPGNFDETDPVVAAFLDNLKLK